MVGLASAKILVVCCVVVVVVVCSLVHEGGAVDADCQAWGFTEALMCSSCEKMRTFITDPELQNECLKCCASDEIDDGRRFPHATLKVDNGRYFWFPRVEQFISEKSHLFPGLTIKNRSGVYPTLLLEDENGKTIETVSVEGWEMDTIADYLSAKLVDGVGKPKEASGFFS
eukprot:TRINITY_DN2943_c0_g1_i1.p1 TRINITY_DN2943_c0_g1~~TRINITY_DN2943_c0_g1_i1.p1  ORF type:complete len:171 (-),score=18.95 TRINITY_DN2943_c0_g1_i1:84-596(-)